MFIFCRDIDFHVNEIIKNMRCCDAKKDDDFIDIDERYSFTLLRTSFMSEWNGVSCGCQ